MKKNINHFSGCLLGGALGDALGAPVQMLTYRQITDEYGPDGIDDLQCGIHGLAEVTNDTQLTLFTAEGLLRAECRREKRGEDKDLRTTTNVVFRAYLRWLYTQGLSTSNWSHSDYDGWLVKLRPLHAHRVKVIETTTITSLGKGIKGRLSKPINNSTTCGAVIRIAPVGLLAETREEAFELGVRVGAITHGSQIAYCTAGAMALLIHNIIEGMSIMDATLDIISELNKYENTEKAVEKLELAIDLYDKKYPSMQALNRLGRGREAVEALAIGVYCALNYPNDILQAIKLAVNHNGDSDSTGSITGNIVGAYLGKDAIPEGWLSRLELAKEIEDIAADLHTQHCDDENWKVRYPSW